MTDLGHLRIGTADRREAVARIDRAAAEGRLTPAEASDRAAGSRRPSPTPISTR